MSKNKRLSESNRNTFAKFAHKQIVETESTKVLGAAYDKAADAIAAAVEREYPAKDMKVLAKYEMASADSCIYVSVGGHGDYDQFEFRSEDKRIPTRPDRYCRRQPILLEGDEGKSYREYAAARKEYKSAVDKRLADFKALIWNTPTFNALVDVWPAAEALRDEIVGSGAALSVLSEDVVKRIKADPALAGA